VVWTGLIWLRPVEGSCEHGNEPFGSIKSLGILSVCPFQFLQYYPFSSVICGISSSATISSFLSLSEPVYAVGHLMKHISPDVSHHSSIIIHHDLLSYNFSVESIMYLYSCMHRK
jgi:hypothetical protein